MKIITLYVDDLFIFTNDVNETKMLNIQLDYNFKVEDSGQVRQCLGLRVTVNEEKKWNFYRYRPVR